VEILEVKKRSGWMDVYVKWFEEGEEPLDAKNMGC